MVEWETHSSGELSGLGGASTTVLNEENSTVLTSSNTNSLGVGDTRGTLVGKVGKVQGILVKRNTVLGNNEGVVLLGDLPDEFGGHDFYRLC